MIGASAVRKQLDYAQDMVLRHTNDGEITASEITLVNIGPRNGPVWWNAPGPVTFFLHVDECDPSDGNTYSVEVIIGETQDAPPCVTFNAAGVGIQRLTLEKPSGEHVWVRATLSGPTPRLNFALFATG